MMTPLERTREANMARNQNALRKILAAAAGGGSGGAAGAADGDVQPDAATAGVSTRLDAAQAADAVQASSMRHFVHDVCLAEGWMAQLAAAVPFLTG